MSASASRKSSDKVSFKRVLGVPSLVIFAIVYMVPLGIFTTYGVGTALTAGHLPLAYIVITIAMLFTAYSYGRMALLVPAAGSAYTYARVVFGPKVGFLSGWTLLADYLLLPLLNYLVIGLYMAEAVPEVPAWVWIIGSVVITTTLNIVGVKLMASVNIALCAVQVVILLVFLCLAGRILGGEGVPSLLSPFYSEGMELGGVFMGAAILCLSFLGFDAISALSEETKDPRRSVPRAVMITVVIVGIMGTVVTYVSQLVYPDWTLFTNIDTAGLDVFYTVGGELLSALFIAGYVAGCLGSALSSQASGARILFAMGRDRVLPSGIFGTLSRRFRTPVNAIVIFGILSSTAVFVDLTMIINILSFGALFAYTVVNLAVIKHYFLDNRARTGVDVIRYLIAPAIGAAITLWLWTSLSPAAFIVGGTWFVLGFIYLLFITRFFRKPLPEMDLGESYASDTSDREDDQLLDVSTTRLRGPHIPFRQGGLDD